MERSSKHFRKRDAILTCLHQTKVHPSADWVYNQLKPQIPDLSLGTVYRNLSMFKQEGIIGSMGVVDGMERFEGNTSPHAHFVCSHCSAVIDVDGIDPPEELCEKVVCGSVRECVLTFTGVCNQCVNIDAN